MLAVNGVSARPEARVGTPRSPGRISPPGRRATPATRWSASNPAPSWVPDDRDRRGVRHTACARGSRRAGAVSARGRADCDRGRPSAPSPWADSAPCTLRSNVLSSDHDSMRLASLKRSAPRTESSCRMTGPITLPVAVQSRNVLSSDHDRMRLSSGLKSAPNTQASCRMAGPIGLPVAAFQRRILLSSDHHRMRLSS
jgi:hypothetical protein